MKKLKWLILVMCCVLGLSVFAACGGDNGNGGTDNTVEATGITLAPSRALEIGQSTVLTAILEPWDATTTVTWKTSDAAIATVSTEGQNNGVALVTAVAAGEATITATANGKSATCKITSTVHITPYYYMVGVSQKKLFDWDASMRQANVADAGVRVLKPVEGSDEKVFTTEIELYNGDSFKFVKVMNDNDEAENGWGNQMGATDDKEVDPDTLNVTATTEEATLSCGKFGGGNPNAFTVTEDGKYEIKLDLTNSDAPVLSYKKVGEAAEIVAPTVFDVRIKGAYDGWAGSSLLAAELTEGNWTATFTIKYTGAAKDFGLYVAESGDTAQGSANGAWARDVVTLDLTGVTGITNGDGNWVISEGVYEFTVTLNESGVFTAVTVTSGATEDENTIAITAAAAE